VVALDGAADTCGVHRPGLFFHSGARADRVALRCVQRYAHLIPSLSLETDPGFLPTAIAVGSGARLFSPK
jgi:hypothetical protein